jgi:P27 family predicted phage terminase small subunit
MKRTGPPKKPTQLKVIEGTFRKDRARAKEPKPETAVPEAPSHLSDEARVEWDRISIELAKLGLLSRIDRAALAAYCECWADWVNASKRCVGADGKDLKVIKTGEKIRYDKDGNIVEKSGGNFIENPYYTIKKRSAELMHKFLTEFGMTPASRTRINAAPVEGEKPASRWSGFG